MNKVLVRLYVPTIEKQYDIWIPLNKSIYNVISLLVKSINEFTEGSYNPQNMPVLYDKVTAKVYDVNLIVKDTNIRNGTELILV